MENQEPLLIESEDRFVVFPLQYADIYRMYKTAEASLWSIEDISLETKETQVTLQKICEDDYTFFSTLTSLIFLLQKERIYPEHNLATLSGQIQATEVRFFYSFKIMAENIHKEAYLTILETLVKTRASLKNEKEQDLTTLCKKVLSSKKFTDRLSLIKHEDQFNNKFGQFAILDKILLLSEFLNLVLIVDKLTINHHENGFEKTLTHIFADKLIWEEFNTFLLEKYINKKMDEDKAVELLKGLEKVEIEEMGAVNYIKTQLKKLYNLLGLGEKDELQFSKTTKELDANEIIYKWKKSANKMVSEFRYAELNEVVKTEQAESLGSQDFDSNEDF